MNVSPEDPRLQVLAMLARALEPIAGMHTMIGGWAPWFLLSRHGVAGWEHQGSVDFDFVLDPRCITPDVRRQAVEALTSLGARKRVADGYSIYLEESFVLPAEIEGRRYAIQVDFMGVDVREGETFEWRSRADLAVRHSERFELEINGHVHTLQVVNAAALICLKAVAMTEREKDKDAYDIFCLLKFHKGGPRVLALEIAPLINAGPPGRSALRSLRKRFKDMDSEGPQMVGRFLLPDGTDEQRAVIRREVSTLCAQFFEVLDPLVQAYTTG